MKDQRLSAHIWTAIEAQARVAAEAMSNHEYNRLGDMNVEEYNKIELSRLRLLIEQLEK